MHIHSNKNERSNSRAVANRSMSPVVQSKGVLEEELLQGKFKPPIQRKANRTGLPDTLKSGIENLSGMGMDDVRVHYNSAKPAQLQAHAYAQGTDIHVAPGQERHLAHEAWHVVQQKQGRVKPTMQMKGKVNVNDDAGLEQEADVMGTRALDFRQPDRGNGLAASLAHVENSESTVTQNFVDRSYSPMSMPIQMSREYGYYSRDGKRKSPRAIIMEEFGDRNRVHGVQPDKYRERFEGVNDQDDEQEVSDDQLNEKTGIWRADGEISRPEDPPIYPRFRTEWHKLHNLIIAMKDLGAVGSLDSKTNDDKENQLHIQKEGYKIEFLDISSEIKKISIQYKNDVRDNAIRKTMDEAKEAYFGSLNSLIKKRIEPLYIKINKNLFDQAGDGKLNPHIDAEKQKRGEEIWRAQWWAAVQKVNLILKRTWAAGKEEIKEWVGKMAEKDSRWSYMEADMVGDVDYIGSLAKGYKSPPKQYVRFMSEKFDVDGNLSAPPLAVYAIKKGVRVDRGSVKAGEKVPPLKKFEDKTWEEIKKIPGVDLDDPFEVFVRAEGVNEVVTDGNDKVAKAQRIVSQSNRIQAIKDRIWKIRAKGGKFNDLKDALGGYLMPNGELSGKKSQENKTTEPHEIFLEFDDNDLTFMEATLRKFEVEEDEDVQEK